MMKNNYELIYELQSLSGTKAKEQFIREHIDEDYFAQFLYYALNPLLTYNISTKTAKVFKKEPSRLPGNSMTVFAICEFLSKQSGINLEVIDNVHNWLWTFEERERELYVQLLSKSVRLGVTATTVNKIKPKHIPVWEIQQANSIENDKKWRGQPFWLTEKLNGVRATFYKGKLISRNGQPYVGLDHLIEQLSTATDLVLDGELVIFDKGELSDNEAFRVATGTVNSLSEDKSNIAYVIFDAIPIDEFEAYLPQLLYEDRRAILDDISFPSDHIIVTPVLYHGKDEHMVEQLLNTMVDQDKEGLMLNLNTPYYRKRHSGILKVKRFYTMDLEVIGVEEGEGRLLKTTGALIVDFNGNEVRVGSGLNDENRKKFWERPDQIIGKICEIKYKEVSEDKGTGKKSLQFPVFIRVRNDKETVSYE